MVLKDHTPCLLSHVSLKTALDNRLGGRVVKCPLPDREIPSSDALYYGVIAQADVFLTCTLL